MMRQCEFLLVLDYILLEVVTVPDVITVGETMVIFNPSHKGYLRYVDGFTKGIAGAEANVAIGLARLGHNCGYISKVGNEEFGKYILRELKSDGVDVSRVTYDSNLQTGLLFKEMLEGGDPRIYYYRKNSAATSMTFEELDKDYIKQCKILHLTGITLAISESCRDMVKKLVKFAKENNILVSFDPNIRLKLWSKEVARETIKEILPYVDIIFPGISEGQILFNTSDENEIIKHCLDLGIKTVVLKVGIRGSVIATKDESVCVEAYRKLPVVDTVGAGDAFAAGFIAGLLEERSLTECGRLGAIMGALAISALGDTEGILEKNEILHLFHDEEYESR